MRGVKRLKVESPKVKSRKARVVTYVARVEGNGVGRVSVWKSKVHEVEGLKA